MDHLRLLEDYAASRSDDAFKALVDQYVGLVYSACFRQLKDRHLAEDAAQAVFLLLSQKAPALRPDHLAGWLLTTARYACANIRKSEQRRQRREQVAAMNPNTRANKADEDVLDLLDDALAHLKPADREALVLRYLKEEPITDVALTLGVSQAAARKRVDRGLEKLRSYFSRRGLPTTSASLAGVLTEQLRGAALPPLDRQSITQAILQVCHTGPGGAAASVAIAKGTLTMMRLTKLKTVAAAALLAAALGTSGWMMAHAADDNPRKLTAAGEAPSAPAIAPKQMPPPATQPAALDLSTPQSALRSFFVALNSGDHDAAYSCLTIDPHRAMTLMDAVLAVNLAQNRLTHAAIQAFGGNGDSVKRMVTLDNVALIIGIAPPPQIAGDNATIALHIPALIIRAAPQAYQANLRAWSTAVLYFHRQGDQWKFDIERSMRVVVQLRLRTSKPATHAVEEAILLDNARDYDQISAAILDGQFANPADAATALDQAASRVGRNYRILSMQMDILPSLQ